MDFVSEVHDWYPPNSSITHLDYSDIRPYSDRLLTALKNHQVLILDSSDQSSKTYFIPSLLFTSGYSENNWRIGIVFPSRHAATSKFSTLARDLSGAIMNLDVDWFETTSEHKSYIQILTPESLLMEFKKCQTLDSPGTGYSAVYFDSFPASGLKGELCLSLLQNVIKRRKEFRLIIGTIFNDQVSELLTFFNSDVDNHITIQEIHEIGPFPENYNHQISGKNERESHNKDNIFDSKTALAISLNKLNKENSIIKHLPVTPDNSVDRSLILAEELHKTLPPGNILIFLPSAKHCKEAADEMAKQRISDLVIVACENITFSSSDMKRYLFFASDVYQIDRTYHNIKYVIDSGYKVVPEYDYKKGQLFLLSSRITENEANLRAGVASSLTYRLYPPNYFTPKHEEGNIMNFHEISLFFMAMRINNIKTFNFYRKPSLPLLASHLVQLQHLNVLSMSSNTLSAAVGEHILHFCGLPLCFARFLIASFEYGVVETAISIIPLLSLNMKFCYGQSRVRQGDLFSAANFYQRFIHFTEPEHQRKIAYVKRMKNQLRMKCEALGKITNNRQTDNLTKAIAAGFSLNAAVFNVSRQVYMHLITNQQLYVHPDSVMKDLDMITHVHYVVFGSIEVTDKPYMKNITVLDDPQILVEICPKVYTGIQGRLPSSKRQKPVKILDDSILPSSLIGFAHKTNYFALKNTKK
ncbi:hypothetical protein TRFO_27603 [Tritrichomonas foetus]|uniref:DEAD-box helicase OB fold domain-containing protein n=1 Tax=Tritrichomonas foetus TaxID=1144522 RepID=A0A1J4K0N8_9EUKA|nr:hypothetical protein TRFO_27603 [Tritrichomonas foetus]|eukprot:OHT04819.1 hypothetical protein TRFO_27603 [Tritrichomonas foetus]